MNKKLPMLLVLGALGLSACAGDPASSSSVGDTSSEPSSSETSSGTSSGSSESSSSSEPSLDDGWSDEALAIFHKIYGEAHPIPYYDFVSMNLTYSVTEGVSDSGDAIASVLVPGFAVSDIDKVIEAYVGTGIYTDMTSRYSGVTAGLHILDGYYDDYTHIQAQFSVLDESQYIVSEGSGTFLMRFFCEGFTVTEWPGEELKSTIKSVLNLDSDLPEPNTKAEAYFVSVTTDSSGNLYPFLEMYGILSVSSYAAQLINAGYVELEGIDEDGRYLVSPDESLGLFVYANVLSEYVSIQFMANPYFISWPSAEINQLALEYFEIESLPLPVPSFQPEYYSFYTSYDRYILNMNGGNFVSEYQNLLLASDAWTDVYYYDGSYYFADATGKVIVHVEYDSQYGSTDLYIVENDGIYSNAWPTEAVAAGVKALTGTSVTVPAPADIGVDYYRFTDAVSVGGYCELVLVDVAEDGTLVDLTEDYAAILTAAGYTYDEGQSGYVDATKSVKVRLVYSSSIGVYVMIESAVTSYAEWPATEIATIVTNYGLTGTFPACDAGSRYLIESTDSTKNIEVTVTGVTADDVTAYIASIESAGWYHFTCSIGTYDMYRNDESSMYLEYSFNETQGTLTIVAKPISSHLYTANMQTAVVNVCVGLDAGFSMPTIEVPEGTLGTASLILYYQRRMIQFPFTFYGDATIGENYAKTLDATEGWTKLDTPYSSYTYSYTFTGTTRIWEIDIMVGTDYTQMLVRATGVVSA